MDHVTMAAFTDELSKIAGVGGFLVKGIKAWGSSARGAGKLGLGTALKRHGGAIKKLYQSGAGQGGVWGGVKRVAQSPYGAMGAVAAVPAGAFIAGRASK